MRNPFKGLFKGRGESDPGLNLRTSIDFNSAQNLFGTLGRAGMIVPSPAGFIPTDDKGNIIDLNGDGLDGEAKWLGLDNKFQQFRAYNFCAPLAAVIDRLAAADTNGRVEFVNESDGTTVKNINKNPKLLRVKRLLKKPNPMQTWEEFNSEQIVLCKIFGYCPVFAVGPVGMDKSFTTALFNLNPFITTPVPSDDFDYYGNSNPIKSWMITIFGKQYNIPSEDILLIKDGFVGGKTDNLGLPVSKIAGLDFFVSNICAAMEADNVLLKKKGPLGIFSGEGVKDLAGLTPMTPALQDELQKDLSRYGLTIGQLQHVISKWPVKWVPTSFNARDLMTKETLRSGIDGICDRFDYPAELMSGKNATYENRSSAEKYLYQTNVIPFSLRRMTRYDEFFELDGVNIILDYDHLPILQEDIMHAGQAFKALSEGVDIAWKAGLLTFNQVLMKLEQDTISGMDIYYPQWLALEQNQIMQTQKKNESTPPENPGTQK